MKKIEKPIEELTSRIQNYLNKCGSIYDPKRRLSYYNYLANVKHRLSEEDGIEYSTADIYKKCGFDFDPDYAENIKLVSDLNDLSDEHNYIDKKVNFKISKTKTYARLCTLAIKHNVCLYDYLVIVTGYRLKEANINLDYEQALIERLKQAYPTMDLTGIRHTNVELYEMLRHLRRYRYPTLSMSELIDILGFENSKMSVHLPKQIDEEKTLNNLGSIYPNKKIDSSLPTNKDLYYKLIKLSCKYNMDMPTYLNSKGFKYSQGLLVERLAQMKVEEHARYEFLMKKKKEFYNEHNASKMTDKERFHLNLQLIDEIAKVDNVEEFIKHDETAITK